MKMLHWLYSSRPCPDPPGSATMYQYSRDHFHAELPKCLLPAASSGMRVKSTQRPFIEQHACTVQAAWTHLPHWQHMPHMPRIRFRHSSGPSTPSRVGTLSRQLSRRFSLRRPNFGMRQGQRAPRSQERGDRALLRKMLDPMFIIEVFRLLTISAAQACAPLRLSQLALLMQAGSR